MNRQEARAVVVAALNEVAPEVDAAAIDDLRDLREQLDLDSMDFLNLVVAVVEQTGVDIPERDYPQLASLDGFAGYVAAATG